MHEVHRERETAAEGAEESKGSREEGSRGQDGSKEGSDLTVVVFRSSWGRMKALQKNQGRTDQLLGAMADLLTSVAIPNQQWVSCGPALGCWAGWFAGGNHGGIFFCCVFFSGALRGH